MNNKSPRRPVVLLILDGFGVNPSRLNNAIALAETPQLDRYFASYQHTLLQASGRAVGLPDGQMGNSEVGHLTIGCGDIIRQDLVLIHDAIVDSRFYENEIFIQAISRAKARGRPIHLIGLVSNGGVHSHTTHLLALIESCHRKGVQPLLHMITDGRDTSPIASLTFLTEVEAALDRANGRIITVCGRYYAMDRDTRWDRIELAWQTIANGKGPTANNVKTFIEQCHREDITDEFIKPTVIGGTEVLVGGDDIIFFNFRKDRARQLTAALFKESFTEFDREDYAPVTVTCMTEYDEWFQQPFAFIQERPKVTLAEVVSCAGLKQLHCAETEKYAHVTYFINGRRGDVYLGEERMIIPSPDVATYDLQPAMSAEAVAEGIIGAIESDTFSFIAVNFANGDMVGHTGDLNATIQAVEVLDTEVGKVLDKAVEKNYSVLLTADHGNCEEMVDPVTGMPHTQHTVYPVPCLIIDERSWQLSVGAGLSSIAPTVLHLMGLQIPAEMSGRSLLLNPLD